MIHESGPPNTFQPETSSGNTAVTFVCVCKSTNAIVDVDSGGEVRHFLTRDSDSGV